MAEVLLGVVALVIGFVAGLVLGARGALRDAASTVRRWANEMYEEVNRLECKPPEAKVEPDRYSKACAAFDAYARVTEFLERAI